MSFFPRLTLVWLAAGAMIAGLECVPPPAEPVPNPEPDAWADVAATPEAEPNNGLAAASPVSLDDTLRARLQGMIPPLREGADVDYYDLGPMSPGDRLMLEVVTPGSDLKTVAAVFDAEGRLFELQSSSDSDEGVVDPAMDEVIRHASSSYYLVMSRAPSAGLVGGNYEVRVEVQRGGAAPEPRAQIVYLNFAGGEVTLPDDGPVILGPFEPADIDPVYAGQNATVRRWIVDTVRQNFARYAVTVLSSDDELTPAAEPFSTVYFGGYAPRSLGEALAGTDFYNADATDDAVVFTERFTEDLFTIRPDARELGVAIGNVATHEIGHLLGLSHVHHAYDLMNGYDAPDNLLDDQCFQNSLLNLSIFPVSDLALGQDGHLLLTEAVGLAPVAAADEPAVCADPSAVAIADLDEDGNPDLVAACPTSLEVWVLWNDGTGRFPAHGVAAGFGATSVGVADLDGNGHPDLFGTDVGTDSVFVYLNEGGGNFSAPQTYPAGEGPWSVTAADLTGDGRLDLAVTNVFADTVSTLTNLGGGTFADAEVVLPAAFPMSIAAGDFNDDGRVDLAFGNTGTLDLPGGVWVSLNGGSSGFLMPQAYAELALATSVVVGDFDGDGRADLAAADRFSSLLASGAAVVLAGDGQGGFASPRYFMAGDLSAGIAAGDLNGDGRADLAIANGGTNDISVLINRGNGTFEPQWPYRVSSGPAAVAIGDLNGDGLPDIVSANPDAGTLSILLNKGAGIFGQSETAP